MCPAVIDWKPLDMTLSSLHSSIGSGSRRCLEEKGTLNIVKMLGKRKIINMPLIFQYLGKSRLFIIKRKKNVDEANENFDCHRACYMEQQKTCGRFRSKGEGKCVNINSLSPQGSKSASVHLTASPLCEEEGQDEFWMCVVH